MNRKNLTFALAALIVMTVTATAFAGWGGGPGRGGCPGWGGQGGQGYRAQQQLTPEQQEKLSVLWTEHQTRVQPIRKDIIAKHYELESLLVEPAGNEAKIKNIAKELGALKAKMFEAKVAYREGLAELGIQNFGRGNGRSWGHGMGRGNGPCGGAANCPGYGQQGYGVNCPGGGPCGTGNTVAPCPSGYCG